MRLRSPSRSPSVFLALAAASVAAGPGCGVVTGRVFDQEVRVASLPPGARVFVDGRATELVTPAVVPLDRDENHTVWVEKEGWERPPNQLVVREVRDWIVVVDAAFAVVLIGFVFLLVDDQLGSDSDLVPGELEFEMRPLSRLAPETDGGRLAAGPAPLSRGRIGGRRAPHAARAPPVPHLPS